MLLQFSVSNFRSFRKRQTLNMAASGSDKTLPGNSFTLDLPGLTPRHWLMGVAIYGANASGKTTVIEALMALAKMVTTSAKMTDPADPIPQIEPFALRPGEAESPTAFEVALVVGGRRFSYRVAATRERVWHESLQAYPTAKAQTWFRRDWKPEQKRYEWSPERPTDFPRDPRLEGDTLRNMLFLSKHIASNRTELEPVFRWFKDNLHCLHLGANWRIGQGFTLKQMQEGTVLFERIVKLLRHADLGVTGARVLEEMPEVVELMELLSKDEMNGDRTALLDQLRKERVLKPQLMHRGAGGVDIALPWGAESAGTHRLFALVGPWLDILAQGHVVCIDELDTSMHPLMVMELLKLFFSEKTNPRAAQIIFTTHNPLLLDHTLLRRDQVWFTDKDQEGEGHLYPLTSYAPRKDESLIRGYLSDRYGAVPFITKGLLGQAPSYELAGEDGKKTGKETEVQ